MNADINFNMVAEGVSPESNFFIQSFLGFSWVMLPASLVIMTVLISQTERTNNGILKMLALPISGMKLCLAKFCVLLFLMATEIFIMLLAYFPSVILASKQCKYEFMLDPLYVFKICGLLFIISIPMAAIYWLISVLLKNPVASVGVGLATVVPIVLAINTKVWFAYPMCYPMMTITSEMHKLATKMGTFPLNMLPWIPVAIGFTLIALGIACAIFGKAERK
ncbi:MAG: hypothetical protein K0R90_1584, partial [Oscillospiraceae bacterium]|nr:hypothetical protein [Oscillospiraceae bacterium]